jgi:hypothetical protein
MYSYEFFEFYHFRSPTAVMSSLKFSTLADAWGSGVTPPHTPSVEEPREQSTVVSINCYGTGCGGGGGGGFATTPPKNKHKGRFGIFKFF